jgi:hypothetical protein
MPGTLGHKIRARELPLIGWRERVLLPEMGIGPLVAKVDTGARSAALHAEDIVIRGAAVHFKVPLDGRVHHCSLPLRGARRVKSTSGHSQHRLVVETTVSVGGHSYETEITLTDRTDMGVPMLLGRVFLRRRFLVHAGRSFLLSKTTKRAAS